jgi:beta-glucosidase
VNLAHGAAVDILRQRVAGSSIGAIYNYQPCLPSTPADAEAANRCDAYWNKAFPDPQCLGRYPESLQRSIDAFMQPGDLARIAKRVDWFGLNHYSPVFVKDDSTSLLKFGFGEKPAELPITPNGWPISPKAFEQTLLTVSRRYSLPIYVLENGLGGNDAPDPDGKVRDPERIGFLHAYIDAMNTAVATGADVRGYFVWSLLDNFEWDAGYSVRFGLTYIDYTNQRRVPKSSFEWYRDLIKAARAHDKKSYAGKGR